MLSKNRGEKTVRLYRTTDAPNSQIAQPIQKIKLRLPVTDACLLPGTDSVAVLSYGMIYFFEMKKEQLLPLSRVRIKKSKQSEAITFIDKNTLMYSNEQGEMYRLNLK